MLDPADRERFADLARTSLAAGATPDDLIADLRRRVYAAYLVRQRLSR
jgi:hypothetical protein